MGSVTVVNPHLNKLAELSWCLGNHVNELDVRCNALTVDVNTRGSLVLGHGDSDTGAVTQCNNRLNEALAKCLLACDGGSLVILKRSCQHLMNTGAEVLLEAYGMDEDEDEDEDGLRLS